MASGVGIRTVAMKHARLLGTVWLFVIGQGIRRSGSLPAFHVPERGLFSCAVMLFPNAIH